VIFHYKCTQYYSKEHERALYYADEDINIYWSVDNPIVSDKDKSAKRLKELGNENLF
jgi:dTDP-4-dehydrorhamnose 3,5-epimerase